MKAFKTAAIAAAGMALAGCSASAEPVTQEALIEALEGSGASIVEITEEDPNDSGMVPGGYQHHIGIVLEEVEPKGGQFFICEKREPCDEVKAYFDELAALAGPHRYQSDSGMVVAQLNSEVSQETADQIVAAIEEF